MKTMEELQGTYPKEEEYYQQYQEPTRSLLHLSDYRLTNSALDRISAGVGMTIAGPKAQGPNVNQREVIDDE
jgi:hypothetical protein